LESGPLSPSTSQAVPLDEVKGSLQHKFLALVDKELRKVVTWYEIKRIEIFDRYDRLNMETKQEMEPAKNSPRLRSLSHSENEPPSERTGLINKNRRHSDISVDLEAGISDIYNVDLERIAKMRGDLKKRLTDVYVKLSELKSFAELNWEGIRKGIKKYDKVNGCKLKDQYLNNVMSKESPYLEENKIKLKEAIDTITQHYAKITTTRESCIRKKHRVEGHGVT